MVEQVNPKTAFDILKNDENSVLIDVRTEAEFVFVGVVEDSQLKNKAILLPWLIYPNMSENNEFANKIEENIEAIFGQKNKNARLYFICKTGGRSNMAAQFMKNIGYDNCFNIANGFEGEQDQNKHRSNINGWRAEGLPWRQN